MDRPAKCARADPRMVEKVRAIFASLHKYIHAKTIYSSNNPNVAKFAEAFHQSFRSFFAQENELVLAIEQYRITWNNEVVYDNQQNTDSIAFLLYKDGIGEMTFPSSTPADELDQFVGLLKEEIYTPSAQVDMVGKFWQSDFKNISYRVFDECADGTSGDGQGSGDESREEPLKVNDHRPSPSSEAGEETTASRLDDSPEPLVSYLHRLVDQQSPGATPNQKEGRLQDLLESMFGLSDEELDSWVEEFHGFKDEDKLLWFIHTMLDFTQMHHTPPVVRDILDIIERVVRYVVREANIQTLIALLDLQKELADEAPTAPDFVYLPELIARELTDDAFLLSLARIPGRSHDDAHDLLRYYRLVGKTAVPGLRVLLTHIHDLSLHRETCDTLLALTGSDIMPVVEDLDLGKREEAIDAVYLVTQAGIKEIPAVIGRLTTSPDLPVRESLIDYLVFAGSDEAAGLLCRLMEDPDEGVRTKTFAAVEDFKHPKIVEKVTALCFGPDNSTKSAGERERLVRSAGKLAGTAVLPQIGQMTKKKAWLPFGKTRGRGEKLLAVSALRYISGDESLAMLKALAEDGDHLVKTKALYALRQLADGESPCEDAQELVAAEEKE